MAIDINSLAIYMTSFILKLRVILVLTAIIGVVWLFSRFMNNSQDSIEGNLGIKLPQNARNIHFMFEEAKDLRVVTMWAKMDIPLEDTEKLAQELDLYKEPNFLDWPEPEQKINWWTAPSAKEIYAISNRWMKVSGNLKPGSLCFVWHKGELYIYHHGFYGFCKSARPKISFKSEHE